MVVGSGSTVGAAVTASDVEFVHDGMQKGAIGINLGRNVWKHQHAVAMAKALRAIIHENADVEGAQEIFRVTSNE